MSREDRTERRPHPIKSSRRATINKSLNKLKLKNKLWVLHSTVAQISFQGSFDFVYILE